MDRGSPSYRLRTWGGPPDRVCEAHCPHITRRNPDGEVEMCGAGPPGLPRPDDPSDLEASLVLSRRGGDDSAGIV